ncbi:T9SS type B sorting domain-containing protein [Algibacter mikhailovii]|uniref:T9SS type B sorting domain-containing protein n=1 Tax=Algibacter mikhailovii TaxID=425498 RepID=UPI0024941697|nr:T9SS type B sorting domain-containing protein [Algibacter mikhailovii]
MKKALFLIFCVLRLTTYAQNEATNWYFGFNSGIKFNLANNTVSALSDGKLNTIEGCATISDDLGKLLFYTDGITVWNRNNDIMRNGTGLRGDPSSTQSAIIVPKPNSDTIYYIFTVDDHSFDFFGNPLPHYGLNYSVVDISLDNGLGEIISKNINLLQECSEKITAVIKNCITGSIWVIGFASQNSNTDIFDTFHAFEIGDSGVSPLAVKSTFNISILDKRGYLKLSPDGTKMACANAIDGLYLYDFDANTGKVSNQLPLTIDFKADRPYGVEFSPNNQLLYVSSSNDFFDFENPRNNDIESNHKSLLTQFNLHATNIDASAITIDDRNLYRGALQLGPNGKIYRALSGTYFNGKNALGVINNPNQLGLACDYKHNAISLGISESSQGLPPFISSFFNKKIDIIKNGKSTSSLGLCAGDSYTLSADIIPNATYSWTRDKIELSETSSTLEILESGYYEVYINPNNGGCAIEGEAFVTFNANPEALNNTLLQCDDDSDGLTVFNLEESISALTNNKPDRTVKFFSNASRTNEILEDAYRNTTNPQTIFVKVIDDITDCFSFSELTLEVSVTSAEDFDLTVCDDDGVEDGLHSFDLNQAGNNITENLPSDLTINYYETYNDALLEQNELNTSYSNTTPNFQTIFARLENNNSCYSINSINLIVNALPNISLDEETFYCLNTFPKPITINAGDLDSINSYSYQWSTGERSHEINVNETGIYSVTITNSFGCSKTKRITVAPSNIATFESVNITDASENNTITVITSGDGAYQYQLLDSKNSVITPFQDSNIFLNVFPGIYTISVRDTKNDCGITTKKVSVIGFPKFFTPNNDGYHDTWQIYGVSEMFQPNTKIQIFNRYGKLIKELNPLGEGWNGTLNGIKLPADDYWFSVILQDGRVFKNHFALIN